jgi:hypothetical protein
MKNFFLKWLPVVVVFVTGFNAISAYGADNMMAVYANITALCGWTALAFDGFTRPEFNSNKE